MQQSPWLVHLTLVATIISWGVTHPMVKAVLGQFDPMAFLAARFGILTALALAVMVWQHGWATLRAPRADLPRLAVSGLLGYTTYQLGFVFGVHRSTAFSSALLVATIPLISAALLAALRVERVRPLQWAGMGLAFAGVATFLADKLARGLAGAGAGDLMLLGAAVAFALYGIVNKPLVQRYSGVQLMGWSAVFGGIPLLLAGLPALLSQDWGRVDLWGWVVLLYSVVVPIYVGYALWNWAIKRIGVSRTAPYSALTPVVSGALSWAWLGEPFTGPKLLGAAVVLGGLLLASRPAGPVARGSVRA